MKNLAERLVDAREKKGWKKADLQRAAKLKSPSTLTELENGSRTESPQLPVIADALGVEVLWLQHGRGARYRQKITSTDFGNLLNSSKNNELESDAEFPRAQAGKNIKELASASRIKRADELSVIRQYDTGGAMGNGLLLRDQPGVIHGWQVNREWIDKNCRNNTGVKNLCIVTGFGDSMRPMYNPGDPLLIDSGVKIMESDGVYFFRINGEGFIKRLQRIPTKLGIVIFALSENKEYKDFEIDEGMDFEILGKVLRVWCGTDF